MNSKNGENDGNNDNFTSKGQTTKRRADRRSERHIRYQNRLANILRKCGYKSVQIEKRMPYYLPIDETNDQVIKIRYRVDVTGIKGDRRIAVEIDGYLGHKSKRGYEMDGLRTRRIQEAYGPIDIYRFTFGQLAHWTDQEIATEMRL